MKIFFIRHAHVAYDTELGNKYKVSQYKEHLTPLGWSQTLELDYLLGKSGLVFESIFSSDYCRTIETITPFTIRTKMEIRETDKLRELKTKEDPGVFLESARTDHRFKFDNGESFEDGHLRLKNAVLEIVKSNPKSERIVVVAHGILLEAFFAIEMGKEVRSTWPDVYSIKFEKGTFSNFKHEQELVPHNATDLGKINYYPTVG